LVGAGDAIERIQRGEHGITVADVRRAYVHIRDEAELVRRMLSVQLLPAGLHQDFVEKLAALEA